MSITPSQRETSLLILAEHIEDCEHPHIQTKIINFLAIEGPKAQNPSTYIRFIYNRINLERAVIRAAAVSALAAFANGVPSLRKSILHLLKKCLDDSDDEVRERAYFYIVLIENDMKEDSVLGEDFALTEQDDELVALRDFVFDQDININVDALEAYLNQNKEAIEEQEDEINIDIQSMLVRGPITSDRKAVSSTASSAVDSQKQINSSSQAQRP